VTRIENYWNSYYYVNKTEFFYFRFLSCVEKTMKNETFENPYQEAKITL
jgi:hypothetical protein